jgi:hypothetical protein
LKRYIIVSTAKVYNILDYEEKKNVYLIVAGIRHLSVIKKLFLGSTDS